MNTPVEPLLPGTRVQFQWAPGNGRGSVGTVVRHEPRHGAYRRIRVRWDATGKETIVSSLRLREIHAKA